MRHMLVVDDKAEICEVMRMALECDGSCRVTAAQTISDAVPILMRDRPDGAIIDAVLAEISGLQLARWSLDRNVPVLILTGEPEIQQQLEAAGCPYLRKPFSITALQAETRALWDDTRARRSLTASSLRQMGISIGALRTVAEQASATVAQLQAEREARARRYTHDA